MRLAIALSLLVAGCTDGRTRLEQEHDQVTEAFYRGAWGTPRDDAAKKETKQRFECVWDDVAKGGTDPAPDFACQVRRLRAGAECFERNAQRTKDAPPPPASAGPFAAREGGEDCGEAFKRTCEVSSAFEAAGKSCRPASPFIR